MSLGPIRDTIGHSGDQIGYRNTRSSPNHDRRNTCIRACWREMLARWKACRAAFRPIPAFGDNSRILPNATADKYRLLVRLSGANALARAGAALAAPRGAVRGFT